MIPIDAVREMYSEAVNGAVGLGKTRYYDAGPEYRRAFDLLVEIASLDVGNVVKAPKGYRSGAWDEFAGNLALVLGTMEVDQFLILSFKGRRSFVQFAAQGPEGLRMEAVSNSYLPPSEHLDRARITRLRELGWGAPTGSPQASVPEEDPDGSPNFWIQMEPPVDFQEAARVAVDTLVDVYGLPHPGFLAYRAFNVVGGVEPVYPNLGIKREEEVPEATRPPTPRQLLGKVLAVARHLAEDDDLSPDSDGDIRLRYGSAPIFMRVVGDPPMTRIFSPVLGRVPAGPALIERLNEINRGLPAGRVFHSGETVFLALEVIPLPYSDDQLVAALNLLGHLADSLDDDLRERFGARREEGFDSRPPRDEPGYL